MNTKQHADHSVELQETNNQTQSKANSPIVSGAVLGENVHFQKTLQHTVNQGVEDIVSQAQRYKDNPLNSRTGYVAEADHCATFNTRKALERDSTRAVREPNGNHGGDFKIVKGDKVLVEGEVKYHGSAEKTETAMRGYDDKQLVGPADQVEDIKTIANRKAAKGKASPKASRQKVGREHASVEKNASDCITDGKTKSTPRTRKEAKKQTRKATKGKVEPVDVMPSLGESLKLAGKSGAISGAKGGAAVTAIQSGVSNMTAWANGQKNGEEAFIDAATDVSLGTFDGCTKGAAASLAMVACTHAAEKASSSLAKALLKSSAPAAVAVGLVEVGKDAVDLLAGEIDGEEFYEKATKTATTTGGAWGGAEIGAGIGSLFGPVGTVVGGVTGGLLGALFVDCCWN